MYLSENKSLRLATLCALYVAQGIPWGFVTVTFAAWLAKPEHGLTAEQLGPILAVASLPWSFKFLWGPLMDRFAIPRFGRRRPWIILSQSLAILVLCSFLFADDMNAWVFWSQSESPHWAIRWLQSIAPGPLAGLILTANIFISMQDVAVDALAVDLLNEDERGIANGLMYGSSYFGTAIGGAGLGYVVAHYGIRAGILGQAFLLLVIMLLPIFVRERPVEAKVDEGDESEPQASLFSVFLDLGRAFSLSATLLGALTAVTVKLGVGILVAVFVDYLMKDGGWTQEQYSRITGGYAVMVGLGGSAMGGWLADRYGAKVIIASSLGSLSMMWIGFGMTSQSLDSQTVVTWMLIVQELLLAVSSVALFSLFMTISWPRVAATQFTAYMAIMNLSMTLGNYAAGVLSARLSIFQILIVAGIVQLCVLAPMLMIDSSQTRRVLGGAK